MAAPVPATVLATAARQNTPAHARKTMTRAGPSSRGPGTTTSTSRSVNPIQTASETGGIASSPSCRQRRARDDVLAIASAIGTPAMRTATSATTAPTRTVEYATNTTGPAAMGGDAVTRSSLIFEKPSPATTKRTQPANTTSSDARKRSNMNGNLLIGPVGLTWASTAETATSNRARSVNGVCSSKAANSSPYRRRQAAG